jgi:hypothetical protein
MNAVLLPALLLSLATVPQSAAALPPGWPAYANAVVAADGSGQLVVAWLAERMGR